MPAAPRPDVPLNQRPSLAVYFTADELKDIGTIRGIDSNHTTGASGLKKYIMEAIREKARRDQRPEDLDLSTLSRKEMTDLILQITSEQMKTTLATVKHPGYRYDVKGALIYDDAGRPAVDVDQRTKAQAELRQNIKAVREVVGIDAPSKKRVRHTVVSSDIRKIAVQLGIDPGDDYADAIDGEVLAITDGRDDYE